MPEPEAEEAALGAHAVGHDGVRAGGGVLLPHLRRKHGPAWGPRGAESRPALGARQFPDSQPVKASLCSQPFRRVEGNSGVLSVHRPKVSLPSRPVLYPERSRVHYPIAFTFLAS